MLIESKILIEGGGIEKNIISRKQPSKFHGNVAIRQTNWLTLFYFQVYYMTVTSLWTRQDMYLALERPSTHTLCIKLYN